MFREGGYEKGGLCSEREGREGWAMFRGVEKGGLCSEGG